MWRMQSVADAVKNFTVKPSSANARVTDCTSLTSSEVDRFLQREYQANHELSPSQPVCLSFVFDSPSHCIPPLVDAMTRPDWV